MHDHTGGVMKTDSPDDTRSPAATTTAAIPLTRRDGQIVAYALVDAPDAPLIAHHTWRLSTHGYAARSTIEGGRKRTVYLHRQILPSDAETSVDHINGNRLDNRRANLRAATPSQNAANSRDRPRRSGFRGVYPHRPTGRWIAQVSVAGRPQHLGIFDDPQDAARAYDLAAREQWGPFARTNGFA
jgi:hypothetical protein